MTFRVICARPPNNRLLSPKPAGVLIGFKSEEDWFDFRLENDPRFLERIEKARGSLRSGLGVKLEEIE
jgi:hypothetical protein